MQCAAETSAGVSSELVQSQLRAQAVMSYLRPISVAIVALAVCGVAPVALADDKQPAASTTKTSAEDADSDAQLAVEQARLADKYKDLERLLLRMAEVIQPSDPKRAALLRQAFTQSKERQVNLQFEDLVKLLETEQLYQAGKGQDAVEQDLQYLLQLLLSGERDKQLPNERIQLKRFIDRINKLIREQQGVQGETEGRGDPTELAKRQEQVAEKTAELARDVNEFEEDRKPRTPDDKSAEADADKPAEGDAQKSGDKSDGKSDSKQAQEQSGKSSEKSDGKSGDQSDPKPGDNSDKKTDDPSGKSTEQQDKKSADSKSGDSKSKPSYQDGQSSKSGKPSDPQQGDQQQGKQQQSDQQGEQSDKQDQKSAKSKPSGGQPKPGSEGESSDSQSDQEQQKQDESSPRRRIKQAEDRMRTAKQRLEEAKKRGAADEQQKAIEELKQAKAQLEDILRQLREEEIERVLVMLETRFRKMLQMQVEVYEGTIRLDRIPEDDRDRDLDIEAGKLSRTEALITTEADKALSLLREEGSSVAFPESVEQMREDMEQVTSRLARASVGQVTQGIEQDIIKALEETIAALQKAQKDAQKRKGQGGQGGAGEDDQSLVDAIAELKMIRALQMRVNTRTQRYSRMLAEGAEQAEQPELIEAVKRLGEREQRIYRTTRDIVVGRNQ